MPNNETLYLPSAFVRTDAQGNAPKSPQAFTPPQGTPIQLPSLSDIKALAQAPATTTFLARQSLPDPISDPNHFRIFQRGVSYVYCVYNEGSANDEEVLSSDKSKLRDGDSFIDNLGVKSMQEYIKRNPEFLHEGDKVSFGVREQQGIIPIYWGQIPKISDQEQITKHGLKKPLKPKTAMSHRLLEDANSRAMQSYDNQIQDLRREVSEHRAKLGEKEGQISTLQSENNTLKVDNARLKDYENLYNQARKDVLDWQQKYDEKDRTCRKEVVDAVDKRDEEHKERNKSIEQNYSTQIAELKDQITQLQRELNTERQQHEFTKEKVNRGDSREVADLRSENTQLLIDMKLNVSECNNKLVQMEQQMKAREQELTYYYNQKIQEARMIAEEEVLDKHKHTLGDAARNEMEVENQRQLIEAYDQHLKREQQENHILKKRLRKFQAQIDQIEAERNAKPSTTELVIKTLKDYAPAIAQAGFALASGKDPSAIAGMLQAAPQAPLADEDFAEVNVAAPEVSNESTAQKRKKTRRGSRGGRNRNRRNAYQEERYDPDYDDDDDDELDDSEDDDGYEEYDDDHDSSPRPPERPETRQEQRHRIPESELGRQLPKRTSVLIPPPENTYTTPRLDPSITQARPQSVTTRDNRIGEYGTQDPPPQAFQAQPQASAFLNASSSKGSSGIIPDLSSPDDFVSALSQQSVFDE